MNGPCTPKSRLIHVVGFGLCVFIIFGPEKKTNTKSIKILIEYLFQTILISLNHFLGTLVIGCLYWFVARLQWLFEMPRCKETTRVSANVNCLHRDLLWIRLHLVCGTCAVMTLETEQLSRVTSLALMWIFQVNLLRRQCNSNDTCRAKIFYLKPIDRFVA